MSYGVSDALAFVFQNGKPRLREIEGLCSGSQLFSGWAKKSTLAQNFLQRTLLHKCSPQLMDEATTQPLVSGVASIIWNPIKAERINKFQKGLEELT